jgi:hypothetical protein
MSVETQLQPTKRFSRFVDTTDFMSVETQFQPTKRFLQFVDTTDFMSVETQFQPTKRFLHFVDTTDFTSVETQLQPTKRFLHFIDTTDFTSVEIQFQPTAGTGLMAAPLLARPSPSRSKAANASRSFIQLISPLRLGRNYLFNNQLAQPTPSRQMDRFTTRIQQRATNLTAIVSINHAGQHIQPIFDSKARARCDPAIKPNRHRHRNPSPGKYSLPWRNRNLLNRIQIQPRRINTPPRRQRGAFI